MDLKWQVAMISMRMKKFYKKTGRKLQFDAKEPVGFDKTKVECYNCHKTGHILLESVEPREIKIEKVKMDQSLSRRRRYALMALQQLQSSDTEREQLSDASIEIKAYTQDLDDKTDVLTYHKKLLAEAQKEKEDLKAKVEKWHNSSKNLGKLLNTQMSANDKFRLGYGDHIYDGILSYENEVLQSVFMSKESELENQPLYDRFVTAGGMHAVPPPIIGNYMPFGPDVEIDYSQFSYGPKQSQTSESETQTSDFDICESDCSVETHESFPEPTVNEPKVVNQPKVWSDAPIIEEYESDSEDEHVSQPTKEQEQPSFATVLTRTAKILVNTARASGTNNVSTARHNFNRQAVPTNVATKVNTVKPIVNRVRPANLVLLGEKGKLLLSPQQVVIGDKKDISSKISPNTIVDQDYPHRALQNKGIVDSGCSRHMIGNKAYLAEYQDFNGGPVAFEGSKGYITGKGKIKTGKLDFEDVCFVKELQHFNLFSVSQMCDKKNKVLFTDTECLVLSPDFKLPDENQVLLRVPRQNNMYSFNLENIVPTGGLACLIAKATVDESNKWHRRLGHVNFKNLNKLVKGNLVRGLPSKIFQNDHTCVACQKGKQHKASCKAKLVSSISQPLQLLHMDLFGPTSDETSGILKDFIRQIENQLNQKVKTIRCDNGTEFKNMDIIEFCGSKGIKREYRNARTPQQNKVVERKNITLIEAARTNLADLFLPNTFWAEAVSTAYYVLNRVLVIKPQNKTPYELITGKIPIISYIRPFGCHVTILNTIDHLGKFEKKSDEEFLVGYSLNSKAIRVYNLETKRVEEKLHINFLENKPNVAGKGPNWLFDLDYLTDSMNYQPVIAENKANKTTVKSSEAKNRDVKPNGDTSPKTNEEPKDQEDQAFLEELKRLKRQEKEANDAAEVFSANSTNTVNTVSIPISTASPLNVFSAVGPDLNNNDQDDS
ncbi:putative ribonuclease H-like domain-containing protein [Tanacetum coccineum]